MFDMVTLEDVQYFRYEVMLLDIPRILSTGWCMTFSFPFPSPPFDMIQRRSLSLIYGDASLGGINSCKIEPRKIQSRGFYNSHGRGSRELCQC